jgi:plasmid stabilization system protein ParE
LAIIRFSTRAKADLTRLRAFLLKKNPSAANAASLRIVEALNLLALFPEVGTPLHRGVRQLFIRHRRNTYVARYRISGEDVIVTRIWHGKEDRPR